MKNVDFRFSVVQWFFFIVIAGLVPLWLSAGTRYLLEMPVELVRALRFGALVFYGYSVAMGVVNERWGEFYVRWAQRQQVSFRDMRSFLLEILVPFIVLALSFSTFWAVLDKKDPSHRVIAPQLIAAVLALIASLTHSLWVAKIQHKALERET